MPAAARPKAPRRASGNCRRAALRADGAFVPWRRKAAEDPRRGGVVGTRLSPHPPDPERGPPMPRRFVPIALLAALPPLQALPPATAGPAADPPPTPNQPT